MNWNPLARVAIPLLALLTGLVSCGKQQSSAKSGAQLLPVSLVATFQPKASLVGDSQFNLATNDLYDFVVKIASCSSGFTYTVTSTTAAKVGTVNLYRGDTDCTAGLESFTWDGVAYTKQGGGTLTTGTAIFQNAGNTKQMQAAVYVALETTGILASSKAHFVMGEIIMGGGYTVPVANYSEPTDVLANTIEAANFTISSAFLTAVTTGTGAPVFTINFACATVVGNTCATPTGVAQDMRNMKVAIVWDNPGTYNGSLTFTQCETIFGGSSTAITAQMVTDSAGAGAAVTGISGEGPLDSKKNTLVIVQYEDPTTHVHSYRYFNMDLAGGMNP